MNSLVVLFACLAAASAGYYDSYPYNRHGYLADSYPYYRNGYAADYYPYYRNGYAADYYPYYRHGYDYATPRVLPSGYLADTPAVAEAKDAHLSAVAAQGGDTGYPSRYDDGRYRH